MGAAHNALVDVRACMKCFFELEERGVISSCSASEAISTDRVAESGDEAQELIE